MKPTLISTEYASPFRLSTPAKREQRLGCAMPRLNRYACRVGEGSVGSLVQGVQR